MNSIIEALNRAGHWFVGFSTDMLIQASVLIVVLFVVDWFFRKRIRGVIRYWIWTLVLVKLLLPPSLISPIGLGWLIPRTDTYTAIITPVEPQAWDKTEGTPLTHFTSIPSFSYLDFTIQNALPEIQHSATIPPINEKTVPLKQVTSPSWQGLSLLCWGAIVLALLLLLIQRALFVKGLMARASPCDASLHALLNDCRQRLGLSTSVSLKLTPMSGSPAVCGLFRPVILMPRQLLTELKTRELETVLLHELAHVIRGDLWVNFVQTLLQILFFYNPLLWLANWQIRRIRENAVDEAVLVALKEKATTYPETLVGIARLALSRPALSLRLIGLVENKSELNRRVKRMLARPIPKTARLGLVGFSVLALAGLLLPMAAARQGESNVTDSQVNESLYCVTGKITDDTGNPVAGVEVRANGGTGTLAPTARTTTDEEGAYRLEFGPAAQVSDEQTNVRNRGFQRATIHASKPGFYEKTLCREGHLAVAASEAEVPQNWRKDFAGVVLPNQPRTLNFVMTPSASVQGMAINLKGKPVVNQKLWITGDKLYPSSRVLTSVTTDEQGHFSIQDVPLKVFRLARTEPHDGGAGIPFYVSQPGPWYMKLRYDDDPERSLPMRILALGREPKILEKADSQSWADVPTDPLPQADQVRFRQMLIRMRKANQAWLVCPPETIQAYSYVFTQGDREPVGVNINDPTRAHRSERQGITYYSVIHRLAAMADKIVFTASRQEGDHLVLSFVLSTRMMIVAGNGNGVPGSVWQGCFSTDVDRGTLWLDQTRWVPVRIESRVCAETYHDYVTMGQGAYVPLRIQIDCSEQKQFDWRFKLHKPGLWLLDEARYGALGQEPKETVAVVHDVKVNGATALASGDVSDQGFIRGHVRDLQGDPVAHAVVILCEAQGGIPLVKETRRPISQAYLNQEPSRDLDFAVTDESGAFRFSRLPEGTYRLVAQSWEGQTHIKSTLDKNSRTLHLHGVAEFVRLGQRVDIRPLGTGTLSMDRGDATIVVISTRPTRADPIMMFTGWGGAFMKHMVGGTHLLSGRNTITGLPQGTLHLAMFANDNAPAWAEAKVDIRSGQTTYLDAVTFVGTWSNCRYDPPPEIQPCFDMLKQMPKPQLQALVSSVSSQTGLDLQSMLSKGRQHYMAQAAPHLYRQVTMPNGQTVTVKELLSSFGYVELQAFVQRKRDQRSDRVTSAKDADAKAEVASGSLSHQTPVPSFDWQRTDTYMPPNPDEFFPNDPDAGKALDLLFDAVDKDKRSDEEILSTVRKGFRRTSKHKTLVLSWIGNRYIWNKDPQHAEAIEIMYHAVPMERHYAVYFGLSVMKHKSPNVLRTLADICMQGEDVGRITWGIGGQKEALVSIIQSYAEDKNPETQKTAQILLKHFSGEQDFEQWKRDESLKKKRAEFGDRMPQLREQLLTGNSRTRRSVLDQINRNGLTGLMDDSFLEALIACGKDPDHRVRSSLPRMVGNGWIWGSDPQNADAIALAMSLSKDEVRDIRYNAVYFGLSTVRNKSEDVIEQLINMALADHENNLYGRITWGLRGADSNLMENALLRKIPRESAILHDKGAFYVLYRELLKKEPPATLNWDAAKQAYPEMIWVIEYTSHDNSSNAETLWNTLKPSLPQDIWIKQMPSMRNRNAGMLMVRSKADSDAVVSVIESQDNLKVGHASAMPGAMLLYFEELNRPMQSVNPVNPVGDNVVQKLIDEAEPGQTVTVPNGTYTHQVRINKPLTLRGESREGCVFKVKANGPAIHVDNVSEGQVRLEQLTVAWEMNSAVRRTDMSPYAIWILSSRALVKDCWIRPMTPGTSLASVALRVDGTHPVEVQTCRFDGFEFTVCFGKASQGRVTDCLVLDGGHQGITGYDDSNLAVERCIVSGFEYHGIRCTGGILTVQDCLIADMQRCGIYLGNKNSQGTISNCVFLRNPSGVSGYYLSRYNIRNNVFLESSQSAIGAWDTCRLTVEHNLFQDNAKAIVLYEKEGKNGNVIKANTFWKNNTDMENCELPSESITQDPKFTQRDQGDLSLRDGPVKGQKHGLTHPAILKQLWDRYQAVIQ